VLADMEAQTALAVYGTLRPGEVNHFVVKDIPGEWVEASVRGYQYEITWGPAGGYPGLTLDPAGHLVPVAVLVSEVLGDHLWKVDRFEGPGYQRRVVEIMDPAGSVTLGQASIYETLTDIDAD